jgi:hypothetical protein
MPTGKKTGERGETPSLELSGEFIRHREHQEGAQDPYDTSRTFDGIKPPIELLRRQMTAKTKEKFPEREKRIKFEIVEDSRSDTKRLKSGGYNPYDTSD